MSETAVDGDGSFVLPEGLSDKIALKQRIEQELAELTQAETKHLSRTDKESRLMRRGDGHTGMSYNSQAVVDGKVGIITGLMSRRRRQTIISSAICLMSQKIPQKSSQKTRSQMPDLLLPLNLKKPTLRATP